MDTLSTSHVPPSEASLLRVSSIKQVELQHSGAHQFFDNIYSKYTLHWSQEECYMAYRPACA